MLAVVLHNSLKHLSKLILVMLEFCKSLKLFVRFAHILSKTQKCTHIQTFPTLMHV